MTNTEKAQEILNVLRSELAQAATWIDGDNRIDWSYRDLPGKTREAAVVHQGRAARYADFALSAKLAEDLGDIAEDATGDDADSIIEAALEHLAAAQRTASVGAQPPADLTDRMAIDRHVAALIDLAAAQRFVEIMGGILEHERPEAVVAVEMLGKLERIVEQRSQLDARRDDLVRALMPIRSVARKRIAEAADVSEPRLYQIRDAR